MNEINSLTIYNLIKNNEETQGGKMIALSIIPGIILFLIVRKYDSVDKEPAGLLLKLFLFGALTVVSAILIRLYGGRAAEAIFGDRTNAGFLFIDCVILTALVQEGGKFLVLKLITWKNREFNYTFDAVVYSVVVALGFSIFLNIAYAFRFGMDDSLIRIIFSVPGHAINSVFMGYFYGLARFAEGEKDESAVKKYLLEALLIPVALHGVYDLCISADRPAFYVMFAIYAVLMTVICVRQFILLSKNDTLIPGMEYTINWDEDEVDVSEKAKAAKTAAEVPDKAEADEGGVR